MQVSVGTFNLNNLFSRFNFEGAIDELRRSDQPAGSLTIRYEFTDPATYRIRTFRGRLVNAKDSDKTVMIADRINAYDLDVLAVQEFENIEVLKAFNQDHLGNRYRYRVLVEGNDPRFIDVGILSRLPVGAVTCFQTAVHKDDPSRPVFGRNPLEVEIWTESRSMKLFTLCNNHLKSHSVPADEDLQQGERDENRIAREARKTWKQDGKPN